MTNPSGLSQIAAFVDDTDLDNTVDLVYGGDLNGDVWRFDLSDSASNPTCASPSTWSVSKFATLTDASNNPQPSTATPETAYIVVGGVKQRMVYIGTGKYLGVSDVAATATTQSMYGIKDSGGLKLAGGTAAATINVRGGTLVGQTMTASGATSRTATANKVDLSTKNGWYLDLSLSGAGTPTGTGGERANTDPQLAYGILTFITNIPESSPCSIYGGTSWLNYVDYKTGGAIKLSTGAYSPVGQYLGKFISSGGTVIVAGGNPYTTYQGSNGNPATMILPIPGASKRVSWRELVGP